MEPKDITVDEIRQNSRNLVRQLGFMGGRFAGTELSPSTVHALIEIDKGTVKASNLSHLLMLEKSSVSRLLRKLKDQNLLSETASLEDSRAKNLLLTEQGKERVQEIHSFAKKQVADALCILTPAQRETVIEGLKLYSNALAGNQNTSLQLDVEIVEGYTTSLIAKVTQLHIDYYSREYGFGQQFEAVVAAGLADFCNRLNCSRSRIWTAMSDDEIVGSIAIDSEDIGRDIAHLRWFIVSDKVQDAGVGKQLLDTALQYVDDSSFPETRLWTFSGLHRARYLYESRGFRLKNERLGNQWGSEVMEQCFVRFP